MSSKEDEEWESLLNSLKNTKEQNEAIRLLKKPKLSGKEIENAWYKLATAVDNPNFIKRFTRSYERILVNPATPSWIKKRLLDEYMSYFSLALTKGYSDDFVRAIADSEMEGGPKREILHNRSLTRRQVAMFETSADAFAIHRMVINHPKVSTAFLTNTYNDAKSEITFDLNASKVNHKLFDTLRNSNVSISVIRDIYYNVMPNLSERHQIFIYEALAQNKRLPESIIRDAVHFPDNEIWLYVSYHPNVTSHTLRVLLQGHDKVTSKATNLEIVANAYANASITTKELYDIAMLGQSSTSVYVKGYLMMKDLKRFEEFAALFEKEFGFDLRAIPQNMLHTVLGWEDPATHEFN